MLRFILDGPSLRAKAWRLVYSAQYRWPWLAPRLLGGKRP